MTFRFCENWAQCIIVNIDNLPYLSANQIAYHYVTDIDIQHQKLEIFFSYAGSSNPNLYKGMEWIFNNTVDCVISDGTFVFYNVLQTYVQHP